MKIRNIFLGILSLAVSVGLASCTRDADKYEPAPQEPSSQVYFSTNLPTSYSLADYSQGFFTIDVNRMDKSAAAQIQVQSNAEPVFTVSSTVDFEAGETTHPIYVSWDESKVEAGKNYSFKISLAGETTTYGNSEYQFTASMAGGWQKWGKGQLKEDCWQEKYDVMMYYQETSFPNIWYCMLKDAWWELDSDNKPVKAVGDYYFYWNIVTNDIYVPDFFTGLSDEGMEIHVGMAADFYNSYYTWGMVAPSQEYFDWAIQWNIKNGFNNAYYDGNGGFYLGDWMYLVEGGAANGSGYQFGGPQDVFIAEGFNRTTDYNDDAHFGSSKPMFTGTAYSMFWSEDGQKTPKEMPAYLRYTAPNDTTEETTVYYLGEYFDNAHSLAFTAPVPDMIKDGAVIKNVDSEQFTGIYAFGNKVYVSIKDGSITVPSIEGLYPTFTLNLQVYTKDESGNVINDFGTVTDSFRAYGILKDSYSVEDVIVSDFSDFIGIWEISAYDYFEEATYTWNMTIEDAGNPTVAFKNLSGYSEVFDDTVYGTFENGAIYVYPQQINGKFVYDGTSYDMELRTFDPDSEKQYASNPVLCGICGDGALAFVNLFESYGVNLSGFAYYIPALGGCYTILYDIHSTLPSAISANRTRAEYVSADVAPVRESTVGNLSKLSIRPRVDSNLKNEEKTFKLAPVQKSKERKFFASNSQIAF